MNGPASHPEPGGSTPDTLVLLARAKAGDRHSTDELFLRLLPKVRRIVALRMGCRVSELWDREDLVQETLIDAFRDLGSFEARHEGALCHWLATLSQHNLLDHQRRRRAGKRDVGRVVQRPDHSTMLSDSVLGHDSTTPSRVAQAFELEARIELALLALDERQRRAIELRKLCEFSFEEIAVELGLNTASSARSLYSRAMSELAERM